MNKRITVFLLTLALAVGCSIGAFAASFKDVKDPSWYSESVNYVVEKGYMAGMSKDNFAPNGLVTRAQLTQILYAAENKPEVSGTSSFSDVPSTGKWYSSAILWGANNKIVAGYPDKTFRPNQAVTREQLVSVMYKYAIYHNYAEESDGGAMGLAGFPDGDKVASYARPGMLWAVQNGIISGTDKGLEPQGYATRAQMAVIIRAFMTNIVDKQSGSDDDSKDDEKKDDGEEPAPSPSVKPDDPDKDEPAPSPSVKPDDPDDEPAPSPSVKPDDPSEDEGPLVPADSGSGGGNGDGSGGGNGGGSHGSSSGGEDEGPLVRA